MAMNMNQFRRDPISGQWAIILQDNFDVAELIRHSNDRQSAERTATVSKYREGREVETAPEIFAVRSPDSGKDQPGWHVRVLPSSQPFLQIYGELNNRGVGLYDVLDGIGAHELVIEAPRPDQQMHQMAPGQIEHILTAYKERILDLKQDTRFRYVMVHKNYGEGKEELKYHSHSHIIATPITPSRVKAELMNTREHYLYKERCLFCDIINQELQDDERIVYENEFFVALSPFASRAPFEVWLLPKAHETFFEWNSKHDQLAAILQQVLRKICLVLRDPNYVLVLHSGPNMAAGKQRGYWKTLERDYHWHFEITPRFRGYASFDVGSGFQINVVSPEKATRILRNEITHDSVTQNKKDEG